MSKRSVEVELVLKTAQYKAEARSAKDSTEALDRSVEATDRDLKKLPPDAAKAAAAMKLLGAESAAARLKLEDGFGQGSTALGKLDQELAKAHADVRRFADEFNRTGSSSSLAKLFKADDTAKGLKALKSDLTKALETGVKDAVPLVEDTLSNAAQAGNKTFWQTFSSLPPEAQAGIAVGVAGAVAVAAPAIGAVLTGALLAGVGAAGLGLAIAGQIHDPAVQGALAHLGADLQSMLARASSPFQPVLLAGIMRLDEMLARIGPGLQRAFARIGPDADRFFRGLSDMVENVMPGFEHAMEAGVRILGQLGPDFAQFGVTVSKSFDLLTQGAAGGASALHYLFLVVDATILGVSAGLSMLAQNFQMLKMAAELASGDFIGFAADAAAAGQSGTTLGKSLYEVGTNASFTADAVRKMSQEFDTAFGKAMSLDEANAKLKFGLTQLKDSVKHNGRSLDDSTQAGHANAEMVRGLIQDAENARKAQIDMAGGANASQAAIDSANATYQAAIDKIKAVGVHAGLSGAALDQMAGQYDINVLYTTTYRTRGTPPVSGNYSDIPTGRIGGQRWGGVYEHAQDGALRDAGIYSPMSPARYAFAEPATGGEAFIPKYGDARRSTGILSRAAGWYGMDVVPRGMSHAGGAGVGRQRIELVLTGGDPATAAMLGTLRKEIRDQGGNVQTVLGR